jgi:hypothetical protein
MQESTIVSGFDFTRYTQKGFLFTPETYNGNYEAVGLLSAKLTPELKDTPPVGVLNKSYGDYGMVVNGKMYYILKMGPTTCYLKEFKTETVIQSLYEEAAKMGADAIINFKISYFPSIANGITISGVEVSGFAIKRKPLEANVSQGK